MPRRFRPRGFSSQRPSGLSHEVCQARRWRLASPLNRCRGLRPLVVQPGDSCPHEVQRRNIRPWSTCRMGSWPLNPHTALVSERDARDHQFRTAPRELVPLMTCDAACARFDIARFSSSFLVRVSLQTWTLSPRNRFLSCPRLSSPNQTTGQAGPDVIKWRAGMDLQALPTLRMSFGSCGNLDSLQPAVCLNSGRSDGVWSLKC